MPAESKKRSVLLLKERSSAIRASRAMARCRSSLNCLLLHPETPQADADSDEEEEKAAAAAAKGDGDGDGVEEDETDKALRATLLWELLKRVRAERKKQSDLLLQNENNAIKSEPSKQNCAMAMAKCRSAKRPKQQNSKSSTNGIRFFAS